MRKKHRRRWQPTKLQDGRNSIGPSHKLSQRYKFKCGAKKSVLPVISWGERVLTLIEKEIKSQTPHSLNFSLTQICKSDLWAPSVPLFLPLWKPCIRFIRFTHTNSASLTPRQDILHLQTNCALLPGRI